MKVSNDSTDENIPTPNYVVETFEYTLTDGSLLWIPIQYATTSVGGPIVSDELDVTGMMLWPATHLLAQHLCLHPLHQKRVLESGCGCGLVGIAAAQSCSDCLWVSTDMDPTSLALCEANMRRNHLDVCFLDKP